MSEPLSNAEVERFRDDVAVLSRKPRFAETVEVEYLLTSAQLYRLLDSIKELNRRHAELKRVVGLRERNHA